MVYKRRRGQRKRNKSGSGAARKAEVTDHLSILSPELLCKILSALPLREVLCLSFLSKKLHLAVTLHLGMRKAIQFTDRRLYGYLPSTLTDEQLMALTSRCPNVEYIYGLNPRRIERRRLRHTTRCRLSIPGVIVALGTCRHLKGVETSHLKLMEAILQYLPQVVIVGHFRNHNGRFPVPAGNRLELPTNAQLTSLHLTGIEVPELPLIPTLRYLYLQWVHFTKSQTFRNFSAPNLETFVMRHCIGPGNPLRFVPLAFALASATDLQRLELVGMAFLGRLLQRVMEDNYRRGSFRKLEKIVFGACRNVVETDVGYLMLASSHSLTDVSLQPSLSRDSLMLSLKMAEAAFPNLHTLQIGYVDDFPRKGLWSRADLLAFGLDDVVELPAAVTDVGLKTAGIVFQQVNKLNIYNCPHLVKPTLWYKTPEDRTSWSRLTEMSLAHCHCLHMEDFLLFLAYLPSIECVVLEDVFREPPKGCSYVGLSAGTGLGMSSAIVSNQQELIAVNGNAIEAVEPAPVGDHRGRGGGGNNDNDGAAVARSQRLLLEKPPESDADKCDKCGLVLPTDSKHSSNASHPQPGTSRTCSCLSPVAAKQQKLEGKQTKTKKSSSKKDAECMVHSDDIRQDVRRAQQNPTSEDDKVLDGRVGRFKGNERRGRRKRLSSPPSFTNDKSVGTSDPILEDDSEQVMRVMSESLTSLTIISCGISDICLRHSPKMEHLEVEACRILRNIRLRRCPSLSKMAISQCPKINAMAIARDLGRLPAKRNRILFIQPFVGSSDSTGETGVLPAQFPKFDLSAVEKVALQSTSASYNICVVWDSSSTFDFRLVHRQAIFSWMQLVSKINNKLISERGFGRGSGPSSSRKSETYPWGRQLYHLRGDFLDGSFVVLSDMPWIRELAALPRTDPNYKWQGTIGLYRPDRCGHTCSTSCIGKLTDVIYEQKQFHPFLRPYSLSVYLHDPERNSPDS